MLEFYDSLFRYWAVGLFILIGILSLREYGFRLAAVLAALSAFAAGTYLLEAQPQIYNAFGPATYVLIPFNSLGVMYIWLFSLSQFDDGFRLRPWHFAVVAVYAFATFFDNASCLGLMVRCDTASDGVTAFMRLLILVHMAVVAMRGRADDLIEKRRRFRSLYIILVTLFIAAVTVVETWFRELGAYQEVYLFQAFAFLVLAVVLVLRVARFDHGVIYISGHESRGQRVKEKAPTDAAERHDLAHITKMVVDEKAYLEAGLTIAALSEKVGLPEHRLRRLINQHLGYRNFADFLNHYRVEDAKSRLASIEGRNQQILVIAMDLGYGSLGPFNRAFKERTGLTPSDFRKKALADTE